MKFKNSAKPAPRVRWDGKEDLTRYGYDKPSPHLQLWGTLLQAVISQSATYMLTGKFHTGQCGIYKCEGGCAVPGVGDLVLIHDYCYWDYNQSDKHLDKVSSLITDIVLNWDPNDPIDSMLNTASSHIGCSVDELTKAIEDSSYGGVFGGNTLSDFFHRNPFGDANIDEKYERFCLMNFNGKSKEEVDQVFNDRKLGKTLYEKIRAKAKSNGKNGYLAPICCSPRRMNDGTLAFWINTGRSTQMDGWKTEEEIEEYLNGDGTLIDTAKW